MMAAFAAGLALLAGGAAFAQPAPVERPIGYEALLARPKPRPDATIHYGAAPAQYGQLWLPTAGRGPYPVAVLIHGGCWLYNLPGLELMDGMAADLRGHGVAVWNIEYRRLGEHGAGYPGTFLDVARAIDSLAPLAPRYRLDLKDVLLVGHAAGGPLALWASARPNLPANSAVRTGTPKPLRGVITLAGMDDLKAYRAQGPDACGGPGVIDDFLDAADRHGQNLYADTSPAALAPTRTPQTIVSGALDTIVPSVFGRNYAALAKAAGAPVVQITLADAGHFELVDPQWAGWARIRRLILAGLGR
jgi:acetyl esterase/lipase